MGNMLGVGIAVCVMGCSGGSPHATGGIATTGDDGAVGKMRGTVHVTVLDPAETGAPAAGVPVVFVDPDGTVVAAIDTDGNGRSQADLLPGGSVTAVELMPQRQLVQLRTVLGVEPGDDLVIGSASLLATSAGHFTVSWPAAPGNPNTYTVYGPCGVVGVTSGETRSLSFAVTTACEHDAMEILIWARDQLGQTIAFDDATAIPFVAGGSATLPDEWSSGMGFRASYTNLSGVSEIDFDRGVTEDGFLSTGRLFTNEGASGTSVLTVPTAATGRMHSAFLGSSGRSQIVWQTIAGDAGAYELDGARTLLAWLTAPQPDASGQRFHVGKITAGTSSGVADLLELDVSWVRAATYYQWSVFGPDADDVQLPALPSSLGAGLNPTPGDATKATAILYEADIFADYGAVRPNIWQALGQTFSDRRRSHASLMRTSMSGQQDFGGGGGGGDSGW